MKKNSKISVALHSLVHLMKSTDPKTSEELAHCSGTNPVVIRRILGELKKTGIVTSEKGHGGGWGLARGANKITVYDVYESLGENLLPAPSEPNPHEKCPIMKALNKTMDEFLLEANELLGRKLQKIKLNDLSPEPK